MMSSKVAFSVGFPVDSDSSATRALERLERRLERAR